MILLLVILQHDATRSERDLTISTSIFAGADAIIIVFDLTDEVRVLLKAYHAVIYMIYLDRPVLNRWESI